MTSIYNNSTLCNFDYPIQPKEGLWSIGFADEQLMEIDESILKKLGYFQSNWESFMSEHQKTGIALDIPVEQFEHLLSIAIYGKDLLEIKKNWSSNDLEALIKNLKRFQVSNFEEVVKKINSSLSCYMSTKAAIDLLLNNQNEDVDLFRKTAETIFCTSLFFESDEASDIWRKEIHESEMEITKKRKRLESLPFIGRPNNPTEDVISQERAFIRLFLENNAPMIMKEKDKYNLETANVSTLNSLLAKCEEFSTKLPFLRKIIAKIEERTSKYCCDVLQALEASGANMNRIDLLEHLIGPKAFLLDYYGLGLNSQNPRAPWYYGEKTKRFIYRLTNKNPYELELEIRSDLQALEKNLPKPLLSESYFSTNIDPEVEENGKAWLSCLLMDQDDFVLKEVLIKRSGFAELGINPKDLSLNHVAVLNDDQYSGTLSFDHYTFNVYFKTYNFMLYIEGTSQSNPDSYTTIDFLKSLRFSKNPIEILSQYNVWFQSSKFRFK